MGLLLVGVFLVRVGVEDARVKGATLPWAVITGDSEPLSLLLLSEGLIGDIDDSPPIPLSPIPLSPSPTVAPLCADDSVDDDDDE